MEQFSYSFVVSMLHSLWQAPVMLGLYFVAVMRGQNPPPSFKKNLLYFSLAAQMVLSICTFYTYFTNTAMDIITGNNILQVKNFLDASFIATYSPWFLYAYSSIVVYKCVVYIFHWQQFRYGYELSLERPSTELAVFTGNKSRQSGIQRKVQLWCSTAVSTPMTFGFFKPIILLPVALVNKLSIVETESLILHEIAHIKTNDYLLNWGLIATETLYFFNPVVKILVRHIQLEREKSADMHVLDFSYEPLVYAGALLKTALIQRNAKPFQLAAVAGRAQLLKRISFFTNGKNKILHGGKSSSFAIGSFLILLLFNLAIIVKPVRHTNIKNAGNPVNLETATVFRGSKKSAAEQPQIETRQKMVINNLSIQRKAAGKSVKETEGKMSHSRSNAAIETSSNLTAIPAVIHNTAGANQAHEIVVKEENNDGKKLTTSYRVRLQNGTWIVEPMWILYENKQPAISGVNSVHATADTTFRIIPAIQ